MGSPSGWRFCSEISAENHAAEDAACHDQQHRAEYGIELADDLIDGQQRCKNVIDQNDNDPKRYVQRIRREPRKQRCRRIDEDRAGEDQQQNRKDAHDPFCAAAEIDAAELGDRCAVVPLGDHAGEVIVNAAGEHGAEDDPKEHNRSEAGAHQRAEDRSRAGDVEQLHQKRFPCGHRHKVHAVAARKRRGFSVVRRKDLFDHLAIEKISYDENREG